MSSIATSMSSVWGIVGIPTTKAPINVATFVSYVLPPLLFHFVMAVLAMKPQTRALRIAVWPVIALLALRAAFSVDMMPGDSEQKMHIDLAAPMLSIVTCSLYWAIAEEPLVRQIRPVDSTPSTLMDALDLLVNGRGLGWNWSRGLYIPRDTRPSNRLGFVTYVILSVAAHALICSLLYKALGSFSPPGLGSIRGHSIFDETLPFHLRYLRSSIISVIGCFSTYTFLQMSYDSYTIIGVLLFGQDPAQWPPAFEAPWRATSLAEFWGRRWHQWLRRVFLTQGGYPLSLLFGRMGLVIGAFLSSAIFHYIIVYSIDGTSKPWRMLVGFGMMAPGILVERAFTQVTGKKVCGLAGWVWTMTWLLLWGNVIVDGFTRAGLYKPGILTDVPTLTALVERLVMDFDTWLHAV